MSYNGFLYTTYKKHTSAETRTNKQKNFASGSAAKHGANLARGYIMGFKHPSPDPVQDPSLSFYDGAFDYRRVLGRVLPLPKWEVTDDHANLAASIRTKEFFLSELQHFGPTLLILILAVFVGRTIIMKAIVTPIGKSCLPTPLKVIYRKGRKLTPKQQKEKTLNLFECSAWEALFYTGSATFGIYVMSQEDWTIFPTTNIWFNWPLQEVSELFRTYYLLGLAFYIQALLSLLFFDKPRSDYWEYFLHHIVTIFLIGISFYTRIYRYGLIILILHDVGDVFLNWAKTLKYMGPKYDIPTNILFVVFVVVFILTRLIFLPLTVIPSGYWEAMQVVPRIFGFTPMNCALVILQCLHVFWFVLIVKAVQKQIMGGGLDDIREVEDESNLKKD